MPERSIVALVGASGCGKSTLLNIVAGLLQPDCGTIYLNNIRSSEFHDWRSMTYMFQEDRLFPWRTAAQNVALGLEAAGVPRAERRAGSQDFWTSWGCPSSPMSIRTNCRAACEAGLRSGVRSLPSPPSS